MHGATPATSDRSASLRDNQGLQRIDHRLRRRIARSPFNQHAAADHFAKRLGHVLASNAHVRHLPAVAGQQRVVTRETAEQQASKRKHIAARIRGTSG